MEHPLLTIEFKNSQPVELVDLTNSLLSFADEYKRFLHQSGDYEDMEDIKLYIKQIRTGSIVTDLIAMAPAVVPLAEHTKTIILFAGYLRAGLNYLLGNPSESKTKLTKQNLDNFSSFVEPLAKDSASQMNIHNTVNGDVNVVINMNSIEANALQNRAKKEIERLKEPVSGVKEKVLLYWYQARNDTKSHAGDKAIIESIKKTPVRTIFFNETIKAKMLHTDENPFRYGYMVDVRIDTVNDRPAVYTILNVYEDKIPLESDES